METDVQKLLDKYKLTEGELERVLKSNRDASPIRNQTFEDYFEKNLKIGVFSDCHIGHEMFDIPFFKHMVRVFKRERVSRIYQVGDILEGMSNRPGHVYELNRIGFENQMQLAVEMFNLLKGFRVFGIDGNHDEWYQKNSNGGVVVGSELERRVGHYTNLGQDDADVQIRSNIRMKLFHAGDGTAYATCFDDKTEILTEDGWKLFKDLKEEKVATLNINKDRFEWQKPTDKIEQEFNGNLLHFQARGFDLMVTPNHRMLLRRYPNNLLQSRADKLNHPEKSHKRINFNWTTKEAREIKDCKRQEWQMKRYCSNWGGNLTEVINIPIRESKNKGRKVHHFLNQNIENIAELIAWYVTEGNIRKSRLTITQYKKVNPENFNNIVDLFRRMGIEPKQSRNRDIQIGSMEICDWLLNECGSGSRNKFLPKWLKNQPKEILKIVFDTMINGDGWRNGESIGYRSISKKLLNDLEEIAIKLGYAVTEHNDCVSISNIQNMPTINNKPVEVNYNGKVYCVSVPNTFIMVRRNGKAIWSGNSYKLQKLMESFTGGEKPNIVLSGHYHKALYMFNRNIHGLECFEGDTKIITNKGKKKIRDIKVGDLVLTHKNRFRKVSKLFNNNSNGEFIKILFRNKDEHSFFINPTPDHPILVLRNNVKKWVLAKDVLMTDNLLVGLVVPKPILP